MKYIGVTLLLAVICLKAFNTEDGFWAFIILFTAGFCYVFCLYAWYKPAELGKALVEGAVVGVIFALLFR